MQLSKNETYIAWGLGIALGVGALLYGGYWWLSQRAGLEAQRQKLVKQKDEEKKTVEAAKAARAEFDKLHIQSLTASRDIAATNRLIQSIFANGGLTFTAWNAGGQLREIPNHREFLETRYTGTATTTTARLARFLQYLSNSNIPARIDVIDITAPKPGIDQLRVVFTISALLYQPPAAAPGRGGTTRPGAATTPVNRSDNPTNGTTTNTRPSNTRPAGATISSPVSGMSADEQKRIEDALAKKREEEAAKLAALATQPRRTQEQIEAELEARRRQEDTSLGTQPAPARGGTQ